ncbi:MAG TPA: hypothetical protein VEH27_04060 [Methylomirabilota bacterium]|nr:hypothetical protein [Methylomirabilota bacterium]
MRFTKLLACLTIASLLNGGARACTIFVLTDTNKTLFFNNEDFSEPRTRIWFVPGGSNYFGCAYVGFADGWAQGGLNTEGFAFDWVAGMERPYKPARHLKPVRDNSAERMLESCKTVGEAIEFYKRHREPAFNRSSIMVADKTGASVIISADDGKLRFDESSKSRGFGYAGSTVRTALETSLEPSIPAGLKLLESCKQEGPFATKYSNVFDLRSGEITITSSSNAVPQYLNLRAELKKGAHYYDIPALAQQVQEPLRPLLPDMRRLPVDDFEVIEAPAKELAFIQRIMREAQLNQIRREDYEPEVWRAMEPVRAAMAEGLLNLGKLLSLEKVKRIHAPADANDKLQLYKLTYEKAMLVLRFKVTDHQTIADTGTEAHEQRF